ncbi:efflux RND transporter periplasmic adaptor subunit [Halocola ammonii]
MHHTIRIFIFAFATALLASCSDSGNGGINANTKSDTLKVDYVVVKPEPLINNIEVTGSLLPGESAQLTTQTAGKVESILFEEGEEVRKGQVLLRLDDREWNAQLQRLRAELETAEKDLNRKSQLAEVQGISEAELEAAQLKVQTLEANIEETEVRLSYSTIVAPFSGRIGLRNVSPGSYISAGTAVAMLVQDDPIKLQFEVPERYASMVTPGQGLRFSANNRPEPFKASVYAAEPMVNTGSRSLRVRAKADNKKRELIPGSYADITFTLDSLDEAIMVPTEAIIPELNNQLVYTFKNGKAEKVQVRTGVRHPKRIQVTEGLQQGDSVVVTGLLQIKPGMAIAGDKQLEVESFDKKE